MDGSKQTVSPWGETARLIVKQAAANAGAAAATVIGGPIAGAAAAPVLRALIESQNAQLRQLESIKKDTQSLIQGPYKVGMDWLGEAAEEETKKKRQEYFERARDEFMRAQAQENDEFRKAVAQFQLGTCYTLLGDNRGGRKWLQAAHQTATGYLRDKTNQVEAAAEKYEKYVRYTDAVYQAGEKAWEKVDRPAVKGPTLLAAGALISAGIIAAPAYLAALGIGAVGAGAVAGAKELAEEKYHRVQAELTSENPAILSFLQALEDAREEELRYEKRPLALEFDEPT